LFLLISLYTITTSASDCHYNYYGDINSNWKHLHCPNSCNNDIYNYQSPIEIQAQYPDPNLKRLFFSYPNTQVFVRALHTEEIVEVSPIWPEVRIIFPSNYEGGFYNQHLSESRFQLIQLHFHTPAENIITMNGRTRDDACIHMVHRNIDTQELAVIDLMFRIGNFSNNEIVNEVYDIVKNVTTSPNETEFLSTFQTHFNFMFNELIDNNQDGYWYFQGSLTAPPCTEIVHWHVLQYEFTMTQTIFNLFHFIVGNNSRPIQRVFEVGHDYVGYYNPPAPSTSSQATQQTTSALNNTVTTASESKPKPKVGLAIVVLVGFIIFLIAFGGALSFIKRSRDRRGFIEHD